MGSRARDQVRFAAAPGIADPQVWGVWDRRRKCWAEPPHYCDEAAKRIAAKMAEAYAEGSAEATNATGQRGLPFQPAFMRDGDYKVWGVWDRRLECWAEPTRYVQDWAERIAHLLNETYAAGLTDAMIAKVRSRRRRSH